MTRVTLTKFYYEPLPDTDEGIIELISADPYDFLHETTWDIERNAPEPEHHTS